MSISRLRVSNFKSFEEIDVELGAFNVVVGANASGKSNFTDIFRFLRDIRSSGLENAISMLVGEPEYLANMYGQEHQTMIQFFSDTSTYLSEGKRGFVRGKGLSYTFVLSFEGGGVSVLSDELRRELEFVEEKDTCDAGDIVGTASATIMVRDRKPVLSFETPGSIELSEEDVFPPLLAQEELSPKSLLIESAVPFIPSRLFGRDVRVYDFDPKLAKTGTPATGKVDLEEDGKNLAIVLRNLMQDDEKRRKFTNLVKDLLPFIDETGVEQFADKSLLFKVREVFPASEQQYLPASLISDGTINVIALILALYFEKGPLAIIEEPERNIHPSLLSRVVTMMKEASRNKQLIVTTHNPELIKHVDNEDVLLVSRDKRGSSSISRPAGKESVKAFLKEDMGLDELYVQNLLGV